MKNEIESVKNNIISLNKELENKKELLGMYNSLVDYDNGQQTLLLVFKKHCIHFCYFICSNIRRNICSIIYTYFSKLFYNAYKLKEDDEWYFITLANEAKAENKNQPLLGFTLLFILFLILSGVLIKHFIV